jgi:5'-deoxynucleotidase YfbR-like HD superfamily hydrolase
MSQQPVQFNLNQIFESNNVATAADILHLVRSLARVPRAHTLPMARRESILEHCIRCTHLADWMNEQGCITPKLNPADLTGLKNYLLYHDVQEAVIGDIPYYIEKYLGSEPSKVRDRITTVFGINTQLDPEVFAIAKVVDALDFLIGLQEDPELQSKFFNGNRLRKIERNAKDILTQMSAKLINYKIDITAALPGQEVTKTLVGSGVTMNN